MWYHRNALEMLIKENILNIRPNPTVLGIEEIFFRDVTHKEKKNMNPNSSRVVSSESSWTGNQKKDRND